MKTFKMRPVRRLRPRHSPYRAIVCSLPVLLACLHANAQENTAPAANTVSSPQGAASSGAGNPASKDVGQSAKPNEGAATATTNLAPGQAAVKTLSTVSVIGVGETRQVQRVTAEDVKTYTPGVNPMRVLEKLPGVNFQSGDPLGREENGERLTLRGFDNLHLGYTLDGVTLGTLDSGNMQGLNIMRAIIPDNLKGTELAEGVGSIGTFSTSNLGGTVQFTSSDPDKTYGFRTSATFGSHDLMRQYVRVDTGEYDGLSAYFSGENYYTHAWKGTDLPDMSQAFNGKVNYNFGENQVSVFFSRSVHKEDSLPYVSQDIVNRLGYDWSYYAPDWNRAQNAANGVYSGGVTSASDANYLGTTARQDSLLIANGTFTLPANVGLTTTFYHQDTSGWGNAYYPFSYSDGTVSLAPNSIRSSKYGIDRTGGQASLSYDTAINHLEGGVWFEVNKATFTQSLYANPGPTSGYIDVADLAPAETIKGQFSRILTREFYLRDSVMLDQGRLKIDGGFKSLDISQTATGLAGGFASGALTARDGFLPQLGATFKLDTHDEVFAGYSENMAAYEVGPSSPLFITQSVLNAANNYANLQPEKSNTFEAGLRRYTPTYDATLVGYFTRFKDRQLAIASCSGQFAICNTQFANVGSVTSKGVEASFSWHPDSHWKWDNSLSYNDSRYDSNYTTGGSVVPIAGKRVVGAAPVILSSTLEYTRNQWDFHLQGNFLSRRVVTMENDESVPSFWLFNASAGYDFGKIGFAKDTYLSFNIANIFNKQYYSTINSDTVFATDPTKTLQVLQVGAPRSVSVTLTARF